MKKLYEVIIHANGRIYKGMTWAVSEAKAINNVCFRQSIYKYTAARAEIQEE